MKFFFFHIVFEIIKFKFTFALEQVFLYNKNNIIYGFIKLKYPRSTEYHYLKIKNRYIFAKIKFKDSITIYKGYVPFYIDNINDSINIYEQKFKRFLGTIFYHFSNSVKGFFIFNKSGKEVFCTRLFNYKKGVNFKIIFRIR